MEKTREERRDEAFESLINQATSIYSAYRWNDDAPEDDVYYYFMGVMMAPEQCTFDEYFTGDDMYANELFYAELEEFYEENAKDYGPCYAQGKMEFAELARAHYRGPSEFLDFLNDADT